MPDCGINPTAGEYADGGAARSDRSPEHRTRRAASHGRRIAVWSLAILLTCGAVVWQLNRARGISVVSKGVAGSRLAFMYPSDWTLTPIDNGDPRYNNYILHYRSPSGLARWVQEHILRVSDQDIRNTQICVNFYRAADMNVDETERAIESSLAQSRPAIDFTLRRVLCPPGEGVEARIVNLIGRQGSVRFVDRSMSIPPRPNSGDMEINVNYTTPQNLEAQTQRAYEEVLAHMRILK